MKKTISVSFLLLALFIILTTEVSAASSNYYNGKARWSRLKDAKYYNVYYKESGEKHYTHALSHLGAATDDMTVKKLKDGQTYWYRVSAIDRFGHEVWITPLKQMMAIK